MSLRTFRENPGIQKYPQNELEWKHWINEVAKWIIDNAEFTTVQTDLTTAQADIISAARSSVYAKVLPASILWHTDTAGTYPAGNPTEDTLISFYNEDDTEVANRTLRGTLTSSNGNIAVTAVSNNELVTGYTTAYALVDDGTTSVVAQVTLTMPDSSKFTVSPSWTSLDESVAGTVPITGSGK